jgi:hypothetical protein
MATELALEREDKGPLGRFAEVQAMIRKFFPEVVFGWTTSGQEKLRIAHERGITVPEAIRQSCERLPSLLEGQAEFGDAFVSFGLGYQEPVRCIYVEPRGDSVDFHERLAALESAVGGKFVISGQETNRVALPE